MPKTEKIQDFENSLQRLEKITANMENGSLSLEEALQSYEEGVLLARECQKALEKAQLRIQKLNAEELTGEQQTPSSAADLQE